MPTMALRILQLALVFLLFYKFSNAWHVAYDSGLRKCPCTATIRIQVKRSSGLIVEALESKAYDEWRNSGKTNSGARSAHVFEPGVYEVNHRINNKMAWAIVVYATKQVSVLANIRSSAKLRKRRPRTCRLRLTFSTPSLSASSRMQRNTQPLPVSERIINGAIAKGNTAIQSSYTVLLRYGKYVCTGSVIAPRWILSAAHCHHGYGSEVYLSRNRKSRKERRMVTEVYRHPDFISTKLTSYSDIALLKIDRPLIVVPLKLYDGGITRLIERFARESGFGRFALAKKTDMRMRVADTRIISIATCRKRLEKAHKALSATVLNPFHHVCTDSRDCSVSACSGDSGAPLCVPGASREHVQIGVLSYTIGRCSTAPDVFINIASHANWIRFITSGSVRFTNKLQGDEAKK